MVAEPAPFGVAVTRGEGPAGPLTQLLEGKGARVLQWGSISFAPPEDPVPFLEALGELDRYGWIYFSSPRAVEAVVSRVEAPPPGVKMAVVGPSTAKSLEGAGWPVHRIAGDGSGEGVVEAFRQAGDVEGIRVFFPASAIAREVVPEGLRALGAQVDQVTAYRLVTLPLDSAECGGALDRGEVQVVTFASPSAMEALRAGVGEELFTRLATELSAAAMGATTAGALQGAGWRTIEVAQEPTLEGLAEAAVRGIRGEIGC